MTVNIDDKLYISIKEYCNINGEKINHEINRLLKKGFDIDKYGSKPFEKFSNVKKESKKEDDVIVENNPTVTTSSDTNITVESVKPIVEQIEAVKPKRKIRIIKSND